MARVKRFNQNTQKWEYADSSYNSNILREDVIENIADRVATIIDVPTDSHINTLIDAKLGVIENGSY